MGKMSFSKQMAESAAVRRNTPSCLQWDSNNAAATKTKGTAINFFIGFNALQK
jgi:hypothetical protein